MDYVFIDTSIFISENFLEGRKIKEIFRLSYEGHLKIILPIITYKEVLNRISLNIIEALSGQKDYRTKTRILRNIPSLKDKFDLVDSEKAIQDLQRLFSERIESIGAEILSYPTLDIGDVFEKYFASSFPFSSGKKKNEFPDAFAISSLEKWCHSSKKKCFILTGDNDIKQYKNANLKVISIDAYIDTTLRRIANHQVQQKRIDIALRLFQDKKNDLERETEDIIFEALQNENVYQHYHYSDIDNIDVGDVSLNFADAQISSVTEYNIILITTATCRIDVILELNCDEESFEWNHGQSTEEIYKTIKIPVSLEVDIPLAGDEYMGIKVEEINNGKDLQV
jgi:PIN domain